MNHLCCSQSSSCGHLFNLQPDNRTTMSVEWGMIKDYAEHNELPYAHQAIVFWWRAMSTNQEAVYSSSFIHLYGCWLWRVCSCLKNSIFLDKISRKVLNPKSYEAFCVRSINVNQFPKAFLFSYRADRNYLWSFW